MEPLAPVLKEDVLVEVNENCHLVVTSTLFFIDAKVGNNYGSFVIPRSLLEKAFVEADEKMEEVREKRKQDEILRRLKEKGD